LSRILWESIVVVLIIPKTAVIRKVEGILKSLNAYGGTFWEIREHAPFQVFGTE